MMASGLSSWASVSPDDCGAASVLLDRQVFKIAALYFGRALGSTPTSMLDS